MRWYWVDRFEKLVSGVEAVTVKNVTLGEEPLDDYLPGYPHYPHSLMIEGMAQTGGLLLAEINEFTQKIVLAKVSKAEFHDIARPGDKIRLHAKLESLQPDGAILEGKIDRDGETLAEMMLTFAILDNSFGEEPFFIPSDLSRIMRMLKLFDVGVNPDGTPIKIPQHMLDAEVEALTTKPV
ncbi:MAG: beta-hydroxyacyl-ACP dehydratase [Pirellulaceae bacterium]